VRHFGIALALGLCAVWPNALYANDTMARFGAGGLQFQQTNELRMEREDLYLSPLEVRVSYIFRNLTDHDVSGVVAFPMPKISVGQMSETPHKFHESERDGDIFDFRVEVNGRPVAAEFDARAYINNGSAEKDVTDTLKKYGLSLVDPDHVSLDKNVASELANLGVLMADELHHPLWSVKATYHWVQAFPARQETRITHRYKPVLGSSRLSAEIPANSPTDVEWCRDKGFDNAVTALPADDNATLLTTELEYILKTGANWAGSIGKFRLEINKAGADLVSLCPIPGLKLERRGQSFVAEASQYTPTTDIKLLFVYRACDKAPCRNADFPGYPR
jgi:hypothetical protein